MSLVGVRRAGALALACAFLLATVATAQTTTLYRYDELGRLTRARDNSGKTVAYKYDAVGNRTALSNDAGAAELIPTGFAASSNGGGFTGLTTAGAMRDVVFNTLASTHVTQAEALAWICADLGAKLPINHLDLGPPSQAVVVNGAGALNGATVEYAASGTSCASAVWMPFAVVSGAVPGTYRSVDLGGTQAQFVRVRKAGAAVGVGDFRLYGVGPGANTPPFAAGDTYSKVNKDEPYTFNPLLNDRDDDGDPLVITAVAPELCTGPHGCVSSTPNSITYTPTTGFVGQDTYTYTISDGRGATATATINLTVVGPLGAPNPDAGIPIRDRSYLVLANTSLSMPVLHALYPPTGQAYTVVGVTQPTLGEVSIESSGQRVLYTAPATGGLTNFDYTVSNGIGGRSTRTVYVTVSAPEPGNETPLTGSDSYFVEPATATNLTVAMMPVLMNDSDPDGDPLTIVNYTQPSHINTGHGGFVYSPGGQITSTVKALPHFTYWPEPGYVGTDSFSYTVSDGRGGLNTSQVEIKVGVGSGNTEPVAVEDQFYVTPGVPTALDVLANDHDAETPSRLTIYALQHPTTLGTVIPDQKKPVYTAPAGGVFKDKFVYLVTDQMGGTGFGTVYVTSTPNNAPVAVDDTFAVSQDTPRSLDVRANDSDQDSDAFTITAVETPAHGQAQIVNGATVTYTPDAGYLGADSFRYTIVDGRGDAAMATVSLTVSPKFYVDYLMVGGGGGAGTASRDGSGAGGAGGYIEAANQLLTVEAHQIVVGAGGARQAKGGITTFNGLTALGGGHGGRGGIAGLLGAYAMSGVSGGSGGGGGGEDDEGSASGGSGTAGQGYPGEDGHHGGLGGNGGGAAASGADGGAGVTSSITGTPVMRANGGLADGTAIAPAHSGNGGDSGSQNVGIGAGASGVVIVRYPVGTMAVTGGTITTAGGYMIHTFTSNGTLGVQEIGSNQAPVAVADSAMVSGNLPVSISVLSNDSDPDGDTLYMATVTAPAHGTAVVVDGATITYTPAIGYSGTDSFSYTIIDGKGGSATATVSLTIAAPLVIDYLAVAGGGGAGLVDGGRPGAGGAGGYLEAKAQTIVLGAYPIVVGSGGARNANGGNTTFNGLTAIGGGHGGRGTSTGADPGASGGSGGGGGEITGDVGSGGEATSGQGNAGQMAREGVSGGNGGGAATPGSSGGLGMVSSISGLPVMRARGGQGSGSEAAASSSGNGAHALSTSGAGGSGVVILRYLAGSMSGSGGAITYADGYVIHTFTANGVFTPAPAPAVQAPVATNDNYVVLPNVPTPLTVRANDGDANGDALTITAVGIPAHGSAVAVNGAHIVYTPTAQYVGSDSFAYTISDATGAIATATVSITVRPQVVADYLVVGGGGGGGGGYGSAHRTGGGGGGGVLAGVDLRLDPGAYAIRVGAGGAGGKGDAADAANGGESGIGTLVVALGGGRGASGPLFAAGSGGSGGGSGAAVEPGGAGTTGQGNAGGGSTADGKRTGGGGGAGSVGQSGQETKGGDGGLAVVNSLNGVANSYGGGGGAGGRRRYDAADPNPGLGATNAGNGGYLSHGLNATANRGGGGGGGGFDNDSGSADTNGGNGGSGIVVVRYPSGVATVTGGTITTVGGYTVHTFTTSGTLTVQSVLVNKTPVAVNDSVVVVDNAATSLTVRANDSDPDGDMLTITAVSQPSHGTTSISGGATITYTPVSGYNGTDSFTYTISDGRGASATATVSLIVAPPPNQIPVTANDTYKVVHDTVAVLTVLTNDSDADSDPLTITAVGAASHGSAVTTNGTTITYTPVALYVGSDSFTYTVADGRGGTATATVSIQVITQLAVDYLVVGGGGGGGGGHSSAYRAGGGGGGGVLTGSGLLLPAGSYPISVGIGGAGGQDDTTAAANGGNSSLDTLLTALGGGRGATSTRFVAGSGGSGGGSAAASVPGGAGTSGQGYAGGGSTADNKRVGGGGGAGSAGQDGQESKSGDGGLAVASSITGAVNYFGGGGGGGGRYRNGAADPLAGLGGTNAGNGGYKTHGLSATANRGGGGGGAGYNNDTGGADTNGGNGGSGVVIIRYPSGSSTTATGGTVTTVGGYKIHTFTTSGTFTVQ